MAVDSGTLTCAGCACQLRLLRAPTATVSYRPVVQTDPQSTGPDLGESARRTVTFHQSPGQARGERGGKGDATLFRQQRYEMSCVRGVPFLAQNGRPAWNAPPPCDLNGAELLPVTQPLMFCGE